MDNVRRNGRWYVVGLLALLYVVSYVDRQILVLLVEPIKAEIALTDTQLGLLIGPAFALLYAVIGLPVAWLVDRRNRKMLMLIGVIIWSASTILSAYATSFEALFVLRMGLSVGEAVLSPVAISLIGDLFLRGERSTPTAVFVSSGTAGVMLSYALGGAIIELAASGILSGVPILGNLNVWRLALVLVGLPGFVIAIVVLVSTSEPPRGQSEPAHVAETGGYGIFASARQAWTFYGCFFIGNAFLGMTTFGFLSWYPTHLIRTQGVSPADAGFIFSSALIIGVLLTLTVPILSERIAKRGRADLLLFIPLVQVPIGAVFLIAALLQSSLLGASILMAIGFSLLSSINGLPSISIPATAPPALRGRLAALVQLCNNVLGLSVGTFVVGFMGDHLYSGPGRLGDALLTVALITIPIAWILFFAAWRPYRVAVLNRLPMP